MVEPPGSVTRVKEGNELIVTSTETTYKRSRPGKIEIIRLQRIIYTQPRNEETLHKSKQAEQHPKYANDDNVNRKIAVEMVHWGGHGMSVRV